LEKRGMTEAEWICCQDPQKMLEFLGGHASERKLLLFGVACCWHCADTDEEICLRRFAAAEAFAEGKLELAELRQHWAIQGAKRGQPESPQKWAWDWARQGAEAPPALELQAQLLRDIFGNPFRPLNINEYWLGWQEGTIPRLAAAAYENRRFPEGTLNGACLAVLADALEEAGCDDRQVLDHLRLRQLHVRGCFVLDLLLGKE
jgi:hypothetical protein